MTNNRRQRKENNMNPATTFALLKGGTGIGEIASQTLASTTETAFQKNLTASTTGNAVISVPLSTGIYGSRTNFDPSVNGAYPVRTGSNFGSPNFNTDALDNGRPFLLRVCGLATPASNAGNTLEIKLYLGTTVSGINLATTGAVPQATTVVAKPFIVEAQLIWASGPRTVHGQFWFSLPGTSGTVYTTWATLTTEGTAIDNDDLNFCASADWGNAAGGVVAVKEFSLSRL